MQAQTRERILACMRSAPDRACTCEEIAEAAGLSVVTVRRYLAYLAQQGQVAGVPAEPVNAARPGPMRLPRAFRRRGG